MPDDKARKIAEKALQRLSADLAAGQSEALKNYLGCINTVGTEADADAASHNLDGAVLHRVDMKLACARQGFPTRIRVLPDGSGRANG